MRTSGRSRARAIESPFLMPEQIFKCYVLHIIEDFDAEFTPFFVRILHRVTRKGQGQDINYSTQSIIFFEKNLFRAKMICSYG